MKFSKNLTVGILAALLALAGVACNGEAADDGGGTEPAVESPEEATS